ncbi:hypothetical protein HF888_06015 [Bermanella marisrubri]|uniref:ABC transporter substrate-binding protein n=1 Tax=Bermanella marisrubri TaxID=207949 RepID=Q1N0R5_9GAMM|nr:ABC transporter substrate binding protein [Bermanella marisrubri]EAT11768.1 hypothetical protein RED65_05259 [Oceanobacter sp. RED65] [Bermanella marisrubri]QIZ83803.1 hypothetical protein HF888_06015 [Bermanella marisrubri]
MESSVISKVVGRLLLVLALVGSTTYAYASVTLVVDGQSEQVVQFHQRLNSIVSEHSIRLYDIQNKAAPFPQDSQRWIAMGVSAMVKLLDKVSDDAPVLGLFVKADAYKKLSDMYPNKQISLLSNRAPLTRQLALIKQLSPGFSHVGLFYSPQSQQDFSPLKNFAKQLNVRLSLTPLPDPLNWDREALITLKEVDAVLGVDDSAIYNATNIRSILMRLYRAGKPLIGPDKGYVRAGAVASTYSGVKETLEAVKHLLKKAKWENVEINPYFTVATNEQVARSLNIPLLSEADLVDKILGAMQ